MLKVDNRLFAKMPYDMVKRIKTNLDFADEVTNIEQITMKEEIGKPLHYIVTYKWKNKEYRTSFIRKRYERYRPYHY